MMFDKEYHYLIAGLPDLLLEKEVQNFNLQQWLEEIMEHVSPKDQVHVHEMFLSYDHQNLHNLLQGREDLFETKAFYSLEFMKENLDHPEEEMPSYLLDIIRKFSLGYELGDRSDEYHNMAHYAWSRFYEEIEQASTNRFVRRWFRFDQLLRNIQSAWMCKHTGQSMSEQLVGYEEEIDFFVKSNLPDFGLRREFALGEEIFSLLEEPLDILEREFRFDRIRWRMADELTTFNYFDIDVVLAFLAKADIMDRWVRLDKVRGGQLFDQWVKELAHNPHPLHK